MRRGVWFRNLRHYERKLLDLTIKVVENVHSFLLAKLVSKNVERLFVTMESVVYRLMRSTRRGFAERLAQIAQVWGKQIWKVLG